MGKGSSICSREANLKPDYAIICEPSANTIATGHKGKAQVIIQTQGISAHGSAPEKGVNAIYEMAEIIQRVEQTNLDADAAPAGAARWSCRGFPAPAYR